MFERSAAVCLLTALGLAGGLPAQDPILTEFVARNEGGIRDEDGDRSDWIEVHNPGTAPLALAGWHLTDDASAPTKWTFPAVTLSPGGYLLVFASGKDRAVAGQELHANFRLAADGEYLALSVPGGLRTATAFAPAYPPQHEDVAYGLRNTNGRFVALGSPAAALVPFDGSLALTWTQPSFDDSAWLGGRAGAGFFYLADYAPAIGLDLRSAMVGRNASVFLRLLFDVADPTAISVLKLRMRYDDGFVAYLNGTEITRSNAPPVLTWNSRSTLRHGEPESSAFETFDVSSHAGLLQRGTNVLAIHGLNSIASDREHLILPELSTAPSYGAARGFFDPPTPGEDNDAGYSDLVAKPEFDAEAGLFERKFLVGISCATANATIHFTTNGVEPTEDDAAYSEPVMIDATRVLRARAFLPGQRPSKTATRSFILIDNVLAQPRNPPGFPGSWGARGGADYEMDPTITRSPTYSPRIRGALTSLPSLSIVMPRRDMFGNNGLYLNSAQLDLERAGSVELIPAPGDPEAGFQVDCGVRIHGGGSRYPGQTRKSSFRLRFDRRYGPNRLEHPFFGPEAARSFDKLVLRANYVDSWNAPQYPLWSRAVFFRDEIVRRLQLALGQPAVHGNFYHLFINGLYWGVYNPVERPDGAHMATYFGGEPDDYDVLKHYNVEILNGDRVAWQQATSLVQGNISDLARYRQLTQLIDPENIADYMLANFYAGTLDWPNNNWYAARRRDPPGPFRFWVWDAEWSLIDVFADRTLIAAFNTPAYFYARMKNNSPEFRQTFGDRAYRALFNDGPLTTGRMRSLLAEVADEIEAAAICESARWGDAARATPLTLNQNWLPERAWFENTFVPQRSAILLAQLQSRGLYPRFDPPAFGQRGGRVPAGFQLSMSAPAGTIHYTQDGTDPRLPGGAVSPAAGTYAQPITIQATTRVQARVRLQDGSWSALESADFVVDGVVLNELLAHNVNGITDAAGEREPWIELYNPAGFAQSLGGLHLTDDHRDLTKWQIPPGPFVAVGGHLLIWADGDPAQGALHSTLELSPSGGELLLVDASGRIVLDRIVYGRQLPDVSTGRMFDADPRWVTYAEPTPDATNDPPACGTRRLGGRSTGHHPYALALAGWPRIGTTPHLVLTGGPERRTMFWAASATPGELPLPSGVTILLGVPFAGPFAIDTDASGTFVLPLPIPPLVGLVGSRLYFQALFADGPFERGSNALELTFCR